MKLPNRIHHALFGHHELIQDRGNGTYRLTHVHPRRGIRFLESGRLIPGQIVTVPNDTVTRFVAPQPMYGITRVYLAGPMSGLAQSNYPAFHAEARRLRALGYHVENPADTPEQPTWEDYMRHALAKLVKCEIVALLPGWEASRGATKEHQVAGWLGIRRLPVAEICEIDKA